MKKNILLILAVAIAFASCSRKVEYEYITYATLDAASYSFDEDVQQISIPVLIENASNAEFAVSFKTIDGKAVEGTDYEIISPASGLLTFDAGVTKQEIVIRITNDDALTGTKDFSIQISSATEGLTVSGCNTAKLRIKDLNHPLKAFIGEWAASATGYSGLNYSWSIVIEGDESDPTYENLLVYDLDPFTSSYLGLNSENGYNIVDAKANAAKTQIIVADDSYLATDEEGVYEQGCVFTICGLNKPTFEEATDYSDIKMDLSEDGKTLTIANAIGTVGNGSIYEVVEGPIVFTKK